jgi:RHS repeat-associated protein
VYDGLGRRQRKTIDGSITDFLYDGLNPVREAMAGSSVDMLSGLEIDEYFMRVDSSTSLEMLSDVLGSTLALVDSSGDVQTEYIYEPFGSVTASGAGNANELRYTGREDDTTGLYHYRARYYHPKLQRFISEDPVGFADSTDLYLYVRNNPMELVDPTGEFSLRRPIGWGRGRYAARFKAYSADFEGGLRDLANGRSSMIDAGTTGADLYFHCRANCEAAKRGIGGYDAAVVGSRLREILQFRQDAKGRAEDEAANAQGQCAGRTNPTADCYRACSNLIPAWGIPSRHLPPNADSAHVFRK